MSKSREPKLTPIEQQAEEIVRSMVPQSWNESIETVANLLREHEAARKVADAAVAYWDVDDGTAEWDALAFNALETAVREYRALTEPPPLEARIEAAIEKAAPGWGE